MALIFCIFTMKWVTITRLSRCCLYWFSAAGQHLCHLSCKDRCVVIYPTEKNIIYCSKPGVGKFIDKRRYTTFPAWFLFLCHIWKVGGTGACKHLKTISIVADSRPVALLPYTCLSESISLRAARSTGRCEGPLETPHQTRFLSLCLKYIVLSVYPFLLVTDYIKYKQQSRPPSCKWWPKVRDIDH